MERQIIIVDGDTAIASVVEEGQVAQFLPGPLDQLLFISTQQSTITPLQHLVNSHPNQIQAVYLDKPAGVEQTHWHDLYALSDEARALRFAEPALYRAGSTDGAQTRAEAAMRVITNQELPGAFRRALQRVAVPEPGADVVSVRVTALVTAYRMSGSGGCVPMAAVLQHAADDFRTQIDLSVDLLLGTRSVNVSEVATRQARHGRVLALVELALAEERQVMAAAGLHLRPGFVRHVFEVGAPRGRSGMIPDERQARRALALALRALTVGGTAAAAAQAFPHSAAIIDRLAEHGAQRLRWSGLGAAEIVFDPGLAAEYLVAQALAGLPSC